MDRSSTATGVELGPSALLGETPAMQALRQHIAKVSPSDSTVLVEGETGTGKELIAEEIHRQGARADGPFVVVDCGCIPGELLESELFGHEKGAFTGAAASRKGAFEEAQGGTIFLDELGELPLPLQPALLRALENRTARRVGSSHSYALDVRVVAATNRDLEAAIAQGTFRADLFFRVAVVRLTVPPLRERRADIPLLARHFLERFDHGDDAIDPDFLAYLSHRLWPGNVRELRNVIERAVRFGEGERLHYTRRSLVPPAPPRAPAPRATGAGVVPHRTARAHALDHFSREYARTLFEAANGNVARAAQLAEVHPTYVRRWFRDYQLRSDDER